jgi:K+-sensing histidine kinase KdpD
VFDAFFTTKDRGLGAGLGLYICHSIVDEHNGHIAIESNGRQGTTVTIALPEELKPSETEAGSEPRGFQVVGAPVIKIHSYQSGGDNR